MCLRIVSVLHVMCAQAGLPGVAGLPGQKGDKGEKVRARFLVLFEKCVCLDIYSRENGVVQEMLVISQKSQLDLVSIVFRTFIANDHSFVLRYS